MAFYILKTQPDKSRYAYIDGSCGKYDKLRHPHVRYGRNAVFNFDRYESFRSERENMPERLNISEDTFVKETDNADEAAQSVVKKRKKAKKAVPFDFELKYMPGNPNFLSLNVMALLGASFQEMRQKIKMTKEEMTQRLAEKFKYTENISKDEINPDVLDINKDGEIDFGEYATTILVSDMLSRDSSKLKFENIRGVINRNGINALSSYFKKENEEEAKRVFNSLYYNFHLDRNKSNFQTNRDNRRK